MKKLIFFGSILLISINSLAQQQVFTTSDSVNLFIKVQGIGTPCLYIHGGPGSGSYWMEKFAGDILEERFEMIYFDLRGVSRSASPADGNYSMDRMVMDFEEIRKFLGFKDWVIMGHSFSGTILTGYAMRNPGSIKGMMMFNCSLNLRESINESWVPKACEILGLEDLSYFENDSVSINEKLNILFPLLNKKDLMWKLAFKEKENESIMNSTFGEIPNWNNDFSGIGISHNDYLIDFKQYTGEIEVPVLFFYGTNDWTIGPEHYKGVEFPNMMLWESNSGHIPFMENKEDIEKAMDKFKEKFDL